MTLELIGFAGSAALGICSLPQLFHTISTKDASGLSWGFLWLWFIGEVLLVIYQYSLNGLTIIHLNYIMNILIVSIIGWVKYYGIQSK